MLSPRQGKISLSRIVYGSCFSVQIEEWAIKKKNLVAQYITEIDDIGKTIVDLFHKCNCA